MILSSKNGVKTRKKSRCCLCGEPINVGDTKDTRSGARDGTAWTMHMHPECHAHEVTDPVDIEWYEDISEPAFHRADAISDKHHASS